MSESETFSSLEREASDISYTFQSIHECNMCSNSTDHVLGQRLNKSQGRNPRNKKGVTVSICRCQKCRLIFSDPLPLPRSINDHYGVPPETYWKSVDYDLSPGYFAKQIDIAKQLLEFKPGMKAVDIGLGLGKAARAMTAAGFDVYGFEPSEPFYYKALKLLGGDTERFKLASIEEVDFPEGAYDFVTFGAVMEHLYDPSASISKAMDWLKPGGILHAEIPNSEHFVAKIINAWYRLLGTNFVTNTSPMHVPYHLYEFSIESFRQNGYLNGYSIAHHWVDVATIYNIPSFLHSPLRAYMANNETGMQLTVFLKKLD